jgi:hypothetical protein
MLWRRLIAPWLSPRACRSTAEKTRAHHLFLICQMGDLRGFEGSNSHGLHVKIENAEKVEVRTHLLS